MKHRIVIITGPTASGKTKSALRLACKLSSSSIISVDSRQAYKGLPIITGQDVPKSFSWKKNYYTNNKTRLFMLNTVPLNQDINISFYTDQIYKIIKNELKHKRKIILVGGSGFYLKAITDPIQTISIKPNRKLRSKLFLQSKNQLQKTLKKISAKKFNTMNNSDINNPARLIRAIEISKPTTAKPVWYKKIQKQTDFLILGVKASKKISKLDIEKRVKKRINQGAIKEAQTILSQKEISPAVKKIMGIPQIKEHLKGKTNKDQLISKWAQAEINYHKRQLTWFSAQKQIVWYDKNKTNKLIKQAKAWLKRKNN